MRYQRVAPTLAAPRTPPGDLLSDLQFIARRLIFTAAVSDADRQFLHDFARPEQRYPMKALQRLIHCARCSTRPEDREALAEMIRAHCIAGATVPDVRTALDVETAVQGPADVAAREFERQPSRTTRAVAIERHTAHQTALRAVLDSLHVHRC